MRLTLFRHLCRTGTVLSAVFGLSALATPYDDAAQQVPGKAIRLIISAPAGGPRDIQARLIGPKLQDALGQPLVVDNRGGASGIIGTDLVAKAHPDGHTLLKLPTMIEAGIPGYSASTWYGMAAPAKTPRPIVMRLNEEIRAAMASPDLAERFIALGLEPATSSPEEFSAFVKSEVAKWAKR